MPQLVALVVSDDGTFTKDVARLLRSGAVPVSVMEGRTARDGISPDLVIVDARGDASAAMSAIERQRVAAPNAGIFALAVEADPDQILQAMRAGATEFLTCPVNVEQFWSAVRRTSARRETAQGSRPSATALVFFGAKGGVGTTTLAVNCAVELTRLSKRSSVIVDLKPGLGEVGVFLGVRPRYTILDAIDNLHRLDVAFLNELTIKHRSGLAILSGSEQFDRPGAPDVAGVEELMRLLARQFEYIVVDAGNHINACVVAAMYSADHLYLVANPDVPSVRNAQKLLERVRQLGACGERVRLLLNRAADPFPIPLKQIETALGHPIHQTFPSDYKTVAQALNSGVPVALTGKSDIAKQFDQFTRGILGGPAEDPSGQAKRPLGIGRIASLW